MEVSDLIVLQYSPNNYHVELLNVNEVKKLKVNLEKKTWSWKKIKNIPFGIRSDVTIYSYKGPIIIDLNSKEHKGIIGIYDKTKIEELNRMVLDAVDAMKDY